MPGAAARSGNETAEEANWRALRTAWQPIAAGFKAIWWKAVALPDDVFDEDEFRSSEAQSQICCILLAPKVYTSLSHSLYSSHNVYVCGNV